MDNPNRVRLSAKRCRSRRAGNLASGTIALAQCLALVFACLSPFALTSCDPKKLTGTWAVYWYLCGSNLESSYGSATADLAEMLKAKLPDFLTVVIETGGARRWRNSTIDAAFQTRLVYRSSGGKQSLELVEKNPAANMGSQETLEGFLAFCNENYPADHQIVLFWDHGGGSLMGFAKDEIFGGDLITLEEMNGAFDAVPASSGRYEMVCFDACVMASVETAGLLSSHANFMLASQEIEPLYGWDYEAVFNAFSSATGPGDLAARLCRAYYDTCTKNGDGANSIISAIDLNRLSGLVSSYNALGNETLLKSLVQKDEFVSALGRVARETETFGKGSYNMIDLGDFAKRAGDLLPINSAKVLEALGESVVCRVAGPLKARATGLSFYYPIESGSEDLDVLSGVRASEAFLHFFEFMKGGSLTEAGEAYVKSLTLPDPSSPNGAASAIAASSRRVKLRGVDPGSRLFDTASLGFEGAPVSISPDGRWQLDLGSERAKSVSVVYADLFWRYVGDDPDDYFMVMFGVNHDLEADYSAGIFTENFTDYWACIDDSQVLIYPVNASEGSIVYASPLTVNGVDSYMLVACRNPGSPNESWEILGYASEDEGNLASKDLRHFSVGDAIEPLMDFYIYNPGEPMRIDRFSVERMVFGENSEFRKRKLGGGYFNLTFRIIDYAGNEYRSQVCTLRVTNGVIERMGAGIVRTPQPPGTIRLIGLSSVTDPDGSVRYTAVIGSYDYRMLARQLGIPENGDSMGNGPYSVQLVSDSVDLEECKGYASFYVNATPLAGYAPDYSHSLVLQVHELTRGW